MRNGVSLAEELRKGLDAVDVVGWATCFPAAVHGQDGIAHVNTLYWYRRSQDVSQCATASHVGVVDETLARHTGLPTNLCKDGC